jgi:hypothetical protein
MTDLTCQAFLKHTPDQRCPRPIAAVAGRNPKLGPRLCCKQHAALLNAGADLSVTATQDVPLAAVPDDLIDDLLTAETRAAQTLMRQIADLQTVLATSKERVKSLANEIDERNKRDTDGALQACGWVLVPV